MKFRRYGFLWLLLLLMICSNCVQAAETKDVEKRAIWICYSDIQTNLKDKSEEGFRERFGQMCDTVLANKFNTVIVQVRPMADAIYPSSYYPWSDYITSDKRGLSYDPLAIMVEIAHEKGLSIEAWINPYRVSNLSRITKKVKKTSFYKKYKSIMISYKSYGQKCLILDPAKSKSRNLITKGVKELVENYDVDGIHMDDYFYMPGAKKKLSSAKKRSNVNLLVKKLYSTVKKANPDCEFGISPAGNIDNARYDGADVDTWLSEPGYVDYVMPQIYWSDRYYIKGKRQKMFSNRAQEWYALRTNENVKLYVGLALYRVGEKSSIDRGWKKSSKNLASQYTIAKDIGYDGYAMFTYATLESKKAKKELKNLLQVVE